jgi:hypothetical protein
MGAGPLVQRTRRRNRTPSAAIGAAAKQLSLSAPRRAGLMSAAHSGKFVRTHFHEDRFRCGGTRATTEASARGTERWLRASHSATGPFSAHAGQRFIARPLTAGGSILSRPVGPLAP